MRIIQKCFCQVLQCKGLGTWLLRSPSQEEGDVRWRWNTEKGCFNWRNVVTINFVEERKWRLFWRKWKVGTEDIVCVFLEVGAFSMSSYQLLTLWKYLACNFKAMLTLYWIAVVLGRRENHTRYCFCSHKRMVISVSVVSVTQQNCAMPTVSGASHIR